MHVEPRATRPAHPPKCPLGATPSPLPYLLRELGMRNLLSRYPPSLSYPPPFPLRPPVGPAGPEPQRAYTGRNPLVRSQPEPLARPRPRPFPTEFVAGMGSLAASMPWRLLLQPKEICVPDFLGPRILHKYPITGQPLSVPAREVSVRTAASPRCALLCLLLFHRCDDGGELMPPCP